MLSWLPDYIEGMLTSIAVLSLQPIILSCVKYKRIQNNFVLGATENTFIV